MAPPDPIPLIRRERLFWTLQCAAWLGGALLMTAFSYAGYFSAREAILIGGFRGCIGFLMTCSFRPLWFQMRKSSGSLWLKGITVFLVCGVAAMIDAKCTLGIAQFIGVDITDHGIQYYLSGSRILRWMIYWIWSLLYFGISYWLDTEVARRRFAEIESTARMSELQLLRAQVNPHFLFNALNSILAEANHPATVRSLTLGLAGYLRFSLQQNGEQNRLGAEIEALENYLQVEKLRFEEKLDYRIDAEPAALQASAPVALVQPLLENAIKYGQRSTIRPVRIAISAMIEGDALVVTVVNSGHWIPPEAHQSTRTGLANLQRRLQLFYGDEASLCTEADHDEVRTCVRLPLGSNVTP